MTKSLLPKGETISTPKKTYTIEQHVGSGAYGDVYKARDEEKTYAIKHSESDFSEEARDAIHMGLGREYYTLVRNGRKEHFFVMNFIEGESLQTIIDRTSGILTKKSSLDFELVFLNQYLQLVNQLEYMHREYFLLHRDIKPENIMATSISAQLIDLGLAKKCKNESEIIHGVSTTWAGTRGIYSPDEHTGLTHNVTYSNKTDSYSLARSMQQFCAAAFGFYSEYKDFFRKACHKNPEERYSLKQVKAFLIEKISSKLEAAQKENTNTSNSTYTDVLENFNTILENLHHHHSLGIVHGDISPENIQLNIQTPSEAGLTGYSRGLNRTGVTKLDSEKFINPIPSVENDLQRFLESCIFILEEKKLLDSSTKQYLEEILNKEELSFTEIHSAFSTLLTIGTPQNNKPILTASKNPIKNPEDKPKP